MISELSVDILLYIYALLTMCEVKMAGFWPSSFSFAFWSIKDLLYGRKITPKNFTFMGTKWANLAPTTLNYMVA